MKPTLQLFTFCLLCSLAIMLSCRKQDKDIIINESLNGTWNWVRTDGGLANHIHDTHASTGLNIELTITSDLRYSIHTNGGLSSQGNYTLEPRSCIHDHAIKNVIDFSSPADQDLMIEKIANNTLTLSDDFYDGTTSIYARK